MHYDLAVCGGTFDLLHKGHKKFLEDVSDLSEGVLLGITSNSYVSQFKNSDIEDFETRKKSVMDYLELIGAGDRVEIVSINSAYEPLLGNTFKPQVIVVTAETQKTAAELNIKRKELGLPELKIEILEMEKAEDGQLISSTRIRGGEINREGRLYVKKKWLSQSLFLPQSLRSELQKPFGETSGSVPRSLDPQKIITIGDITAQKFNKVYPNHFLSIVDFQVQRQKKFDKLSELGFLDNAKTTEVENPPATITPQLFNSIKKAFNSNSKKIILVIGEEDLSVLPVLLVAPLDFVVFYGQPNVGLVKVKVTEENKKRAFDLLSKFTG